MVTGSSRACLESVAVSQGQINLFHFSLLHGIDGLSYRLGAPREPTETRLHALLY